jgi:drug/metabolite transporter (DMT)-like permease
MINEDEKKNPALGRGAALSAVALLSFGPVIVKQVEIAATAFVFWRLLFATVPLVIFFIVSGRRFARSDFRHAALGGIVFGLNLIIGVLALRRTSALHHMVIMSFQPLAVLLISVRFFGERPRLSIYVFAISAFVGVALTLAAADASGVATTSGNMLSVLAMLLFTLYFAISKQARAKLDSPTYQLLLLLVAAGTVLPFLIATEVGIPVPSGSDLWLVIAMAFIPGTGHLLTNFAHGHTSLTLVGLLNLGFTVTAPLYTWWFLGERIGGTQAAGTGIVIASLAMIASRSPTAHRGEPAG